MLEYAVLIPVVTTGEGDALLLEVRSDKVKQPGEICFPGGRMEPGESPEDAAVRETCEELGLSAGDIEVTESPAVELMSDGRRVWSVVGRISEGRLGDIRLSEHEVAEVFLLPVDWLRSNDPQHYDLGKTSDEMLPGILCEYLMHYGEFRNTGTTDYWEYNGHGIWGLTARIIRKYMAGAEQLTYSSR